MLDPSTATPDPVSTGRARASILERFDSAYHNLITAGGCAEQEREEEVTKMEEATKMEEEEEEEEEGWEGRLQERESSPVLEEGMGERCAASSCVLTRAPAGAHITVTGSDGRRVYLRVQQEKVNFVPSSSDLKCNRQLCVVCACECSEDYIKFLLRTKRPSKDLCRPCASLFIYLYIQYM